MMKGTDNGLPAVDRRRVWIFAIVLLLLCASLGSCSRKDGDGELFQVDDPGGGEPFQMVGIEAEDPHFEIPDLLGPVPSYTYWLADGDAVAPIFKTFEFHWQRKGKMCDFLDNTNSADCIVCDLCNESDTGFCKDAYDESFAGGVGTGFLEVWKYDSFMPGDVKQTVFSFAESGGNSKLRSECPAHNQPHMRTTFAPESNGLYRLTEDPRIALRDGTKGTAKIFVVDSTSSYKILYQLTSHFEGVPIPGPCVTPSPTPPPTPSCPGCAWLKLLPPNSSNGYREESFSPNVRITKVAVLKGTPAVDPNTGRFKLDDTSSVYVHPSRISLHVGAHENASALDFDRVHCYADSSADGNINLKTCREAFNVNCNSPNCLQNATPQYMHTNPTDTLLWFVEFNPAEGGVIPTLNCGEVLAIEFTLERK